VAVIVVAGMTGCGDSGKTDARIAKLERRVARLEQQNAALRSSQVSDRSKLQKTLKGVYANDDALYTGVAMAQDWAICGGHATCHVPLGEPGAV
jgi:hypothetical protein